MLVTIVGMKNYYGMEIFELDQQLILCKDYKNDYDTEAIKAGTLSLGTVGYVSNSVWTGVKGTYSSGRLYDKFEDYIKAKVILILGKAVIAEILVDEKISEEEIELIKEWDTTLLNDKDVCF